MDSSALMAIVLDQPEAVRCADVLERETDLIISAVTVAESLILAHGRGLAVEMNRLIDGLDFEVVPVTSITANRVLEIYRRWGKGSHKAALNFGDCLAYDVAKSHDCPLLYVGDDFRRTDLQSAM